MNINKNTKESIFRILEFFDLGMVKVSSEELHEIEKVFTYGRCEYFLKTSNILKNFSKTK